MRKDEGKVLVLIISNFESRGCDNNVADLKEAFSNPYFITRIVAANTKKDIPSGLTISDAVYTELYVMRKTLEYSSTGIECSSENSWNNLPVIIVKDSSVTNLTPLEMKQRISYALRKAPAADLYFLTVWSDSCSKHKLISKNVDGGSSLNWTFQPTATQAIMYTPSSRDYIKQYLVSNNNTSYSSVLNSLVSSGKMKAVTYTPNIVDYDIDLATSNSDYYKLNTCATIGTVGGESNGLSSLLFFIILVAIVIFTAYCLLVLGPSTVPCQTP